MQIVSPAFSAMAAAAMQLPCSYVEIMWSGIPTTVTARGSAGWTDETAYLISHSGELRIAPPGDNLVAAGEVGSAQVILDNTTQRYAWKNSASPLAAYIGTAVGLAGKPLRIWQGFFLSGVATYVCIFTGIIENWDEDDAQARITLNCRDFGYLWLQYKRSSVLYADQLPNQWTTVVAGLVTMPTPIQDTGIFRIPYCWLDDESVVEEIWQTWEADGGLCYFDQLGQLHCENALHWLSPPHNTVQWAFSESDYESVSPQINLDAVATKIIVEWSARAEQPEETVYELDRPKDIMPGAAQTWVARYQYAVAGIIQPDPNMPNLDYYAQTAGGTDVTGQMTVTIDTEKSYAQQCSITVTNNGGGMAAKLTYLRIRGYPLVGGPTEQEEVLVVPAPLPYERVRSQRGNLYLQTQAQGRALAGTLAVRAQGIHPTINVKGILGVPQLELGDRVACANSRLFGVTPQSGIVTGIHWQAGPDQGFRQDVTLFDVSDIASYDNYFIVGVDTLGAHKRIYY